MTRLHRRKQNLPRGFSAVKRYELICFFMNPFWHLCGKQIIEKQEETTLELFW